MFNSAGAIKAAYNNDEISCFRYYSLFLSTGFAMGADSTARHSGLAAEKEAGKSD